jgi:hypothetical protein
MELPAIAAVPEPAPPPRRVPAIPAPRLRPEPAPARQARIAVPEPEAPGPIPAPFVAPPAREEEVEETRIPEPAAFEDEVFELADDEASYGEENVVWVEGDGGYGGSLDELFARAEPDAAGVEGPDDAPFAGVEDAEERSVAMSDHDRSAARIRRLLDVYESLGSSR